MKKSFKKAGAAVLSMAMLIAMGSVTMPVYAVAPGTSGVPTNDSVNPYTGSEANVTDGDMALPGAVYVSMPGMYKQGEGTDDTGANGGVDQGRTPTHYEYLDVANVTKATVSIYKVAELDGTNGWKWGTGFNEADINALLSDIATDGNGNALTNPTSFQNLLERDNNGEFATKSSELQKLASYLERNLGSTPVVASKVLDNANQAVGFTLPEIDPSLMTGGYTSANAPGTLNKIGYYLITTTTDQAGVLVQPVLISLKNGQENPKNISLKGSTIDIAKRIAHVGTEDTDSTPDGINDNHDTKIYNDDAAKFGGTSATVGKDDVVHYEIFAQLPKYDENVNLNTALPFVIRDVASDGVTIDESTIKAYVSQVDESADNYVRADGTGDNWNLKGSPNENTYDYQLTMDADKHGFQIAISVAQMRGDSSVNNSTISNTTDNNVGRLETMENCYIIVSFDATVDKKANGTDATLDSEMAFDRHYYNRVVYDVDDGVTLNTEAAATLAQIYADWVAYVDQDVTAGVGVKEAVLAAKAAKKYNPTSGTDYTASSALQTAAGGITGMFDTAQSGIAADLAKEQVIAMLLAIDHYNATRNGENNYASMTYGNNYSTGGNPARKIANDTLLTSVDMNLNKYVEKLTLENLPDSTTLPDFIAAANNYVTLDEIKAYAEKNATAIAAATDPTNTDKSAMTTEFASLSSVTAEELANLTKAANLMLDAAKTQAATNKDYYSKYTDEPVVNAVFKLTYEPTGENKEIGYAVSTGADGILKKLVESKSNTKPTAQTETIKYWSDTADGDGKYTIYSLPEENAENAWAMLQTGAYQLEEVYAPTGFKKWAAPVTINIAALDKTNAEVADRGNAEPDGAYKATGTSTVASEIASQQTEKTVPVNFAYYTNEANTESAGILQHKIYNEYQDTLPATGGIGTILFTAGGISVVLVAGALFVMYMKKRNAEDEE